MRVFILDSTLHDGARALSLSIDDKLAIAQRLDEFGIDYIDGGWPAVDPRDREFFARARELNLRHARLVAFGSVRFPRNSVDNDPAIQAVFETGTPAVCLSGETWDLHVFKVLRTTEPEHLASIVDSIGFFKNRGREVIYNAEHFFDAYEANPEFALRCIGAAAEAGADVLCVCDTNGGALTSRIARICAEVKRRFPGPSLGIHAHNDADLAVANSIAAVEHGFTHVQGCFNGYGERCGCANLSSVLPNLELKAGCMTVGRQKLAQLNSLARFISEIANVPMRDDLPYVGSGAFTGGEDHTRAEYVGNTDRLLANRLPERLTPEARRELTDRIRRKEEEGYDLTAAPGSFELLVRETLHPEGRPFTVLNYEVTTRHSASNSSSHAEVTLEAGEAVLNGSATAPGPVNALDLALRQALKTLYASIDNVKLVDYKLRVLESFHGTDAKCRALIQWTDGESSWTTAGVSDNIVEASWLALLDAVYLEILRAQVSPASTPDYSWAV
jgi:2-isopropylmalate synthase